MKTIDRRQVGESWKNWTWHQQNAIRDLSLLEGYFQNIRGGFFEELKKNQR